MRRGDLDVQRLVRERTGAVTPAERGRQIDDLIRYSRDEVDRRRPGEGPVACRTERRRAAPEQCEQADEEIVPPIAGPRGIPPGRLRSTGVAHRMGA